jgi:hypothetical protein
MGEPSPSAAIISVSPPGEVFAASATSADRPSSPTGPRPSVDAHRAVAETGSESLPIIQATAFPAPDVEPVDAVGSARQEAMSAHHSSQLPGDSTAVADPLAGAGAELKWKKSPFSIADEKGDDACVSITVVDLRLTKEDRRRADWARAGSHRL